MNQPEKAKQKVREYLERRQLERRLDARTPLHDPEQIRREIGWENVWDEPERRAAQRRTRRKGSVSTSH